MMSEINDNQGKYLSTEVNKLVEPFCDLGNLVVIDSDQFSGNNRKLSDAELLVRTRDNVQYLFNKVWDLERVRIDELICAKLPPPSMRLPREKPLPLKRLLTKWEQYAQEKGIRKHKKDRKVFDETTKEWKARYGYRRGNDSTKDWLIEIPDHKDPMVDYFAERDQTKREKVSKNEMQRLRNIGHMNANMVPLGVSKQIEERSRPELMHTINRARIATASVGKFQRTLKNERKHVKSDKTRKFKANESAVTAELSKQMKLLERLSSSTKKPLATETCTVMSENIAEKIGRTDTIKNKKKSARRSKSTLHRQQHFQSKIKSQKRTVGGARGAEGARKKKNR